MTDDVERALANPLADGACYHYDISVRPADQWARDEEFATVSSGGAGTRWMIADNLREAAALLDIGRPLEGGRPVDAAAPVAREDTASPDEAARTAPCPDCGAVVGVLDSIPSLSPVIDDHKWLGVLCSGSGATLDRPVPARPTEAPVVQRAAPSRDAPLVEAEEKPGGLWCVMATIAGRRTSIYAAHDRAHIRNVVRDINAAHVERLVADAGLGVLRGGGEADASETVRANQAEADVAGVLDILSEAGFPVDGTRDVHEQLREALRGGGADGGGEDEAAAVRAVLDELRAEPADGESLATAVRETIAGARGLSRAYRDAAKGQAEVKSWAMAHGASRTDRPLVETVEEVRTIARLKGVQYGQETARTEAQDYTAPDGTRWVRVEADPETGEPLTTEHYRHLCAATDHSLASDRRRLARAAGVAPDSDVEAIEAAIRAGRQDPTGDPYAAGSRAELIRTREEAWSEIAAARGFLRDDGFSFPVPNQRLDGSVSDHVAAIRAGREPEVVTGRQAEELSLGSLIRSEECPHFPHQDRLRWRSHEAGWHTLAGIPAELHGPGEYTVLYRAPAPTPASLTVGEVVTGTRAVSAPLGTKLGAKSAAVAAVHTTGGWSVTGMNHEQDHEEHVRINEWVVLALPDGGEA